jgi:hypothetical protein
VNYERENQEIPGYKPASVDYIAGAVGSSPLLADEMVRTG